VEFKNPCKYVSESRLAYAEASASEREIFQEGGWLVLLERIRAHFAELPANVPELIAEPALPIPTTRPGRKNSSLSA
jgi:hypothetical protein